MPKAPKAPKPPKARAAATRGGPKLKAAPIVHETLEGTVALEGRDEPFDVSGFSTNRTRTKSAAPHILIPMTPLVAHTHLVRVTPKSGIVTWHLVRKPACRVVVNEKKRAPAVHKITSGGLEVRYFYCKQEA